MTPSSPITQSVEPLADLSVRGCFARPPVVLVRGRDQPLIKASRSPTSISVVMPRKCFDFMVPTSVVAPHSPREESQAFDESSLLELKRLIETSLPLTTSSGKGYYLAFRLEDLQPSKLKLVFDWILAQLVEAPAAEPGTDITSGA